MIIPLLVFLLILIVVSLSIWALFSFLPDYLKERNLNISQDILSHEEKDIVFSRENAVVSKDLRAVVRCNPERKVQKRGFFYAFLKKSMNQFLNVLGVASVLVLA